MLNIAEYSLISQFRFNVLFSSWCAIQNRNKLEYGAAISNVFIFKQADARKRLDVVETCYQFEMKVVIAASEMRCQLLAGTRGRLERNV